MDNTFTSPQQAQIGNPILDATSLTPLQSVIAPISPTAWNESYNAGTNAFAPYYNQILQNFYNQAAINMNKYQNEYNTSMGYLTKAQQNFMNYHRNKFGTDVATQMGNDQGNGVGSSSEANRDTNSLYNDYLYNTNDYNLSNQQSQQQAKNTYDYSTANEQQNLKQNVFQNTMNEAKDIGSYAQDFYNYKYLQPNLTQQQDYGTNQNAGLGVSQDYLNKAYGNSNPSSSTSSVY